MRKGQVLLLLTTTVLVSSIYTSPASSAPREIVPLQTFADEFSSEDRSTIDNTINSELDERPDWIRQPSPNVEFIDLMFEADCIEPDIECLSQIGANLNQPYLLFTSGDPMKGGYHITFQLIDVTMKELVLSVTRRVKTRDALTKSVQRATEKLFGKKPPPKKLVGTLNINSSPEGAIVYVNNKNIGETPCSVDRDPGTYTVRLVKTGYEERLREITIRQGQDTDLTLNLKPVPESVVTTTDTVIVPESPEEDDDTAYWQTWWFWTAVGVGCGAAGLGIAAATGAFDTSTTAVGDVGFFFTQQADQDYLLQLQRK